MNSWTVAALAVGVTALAGAAVALQNESAEPVSTAAPAPSPTPQPKATAPKTKAEAPPVQGRETPMNERVAVLGLLNKRNGIARDLTLKPGQAVRVDNVIVRLRACETTAPWETQKLTGAFVQVDHRGVDNKWRRAFSGWLYKESPSLNVVEHPIYDVWPKSCTMTRPEIGPDTLRVSTPSAGGAAGRSSAPKSGPAPAPPATPEPSASPSNPT